jgi:endonuclease/exonuclease/phosphatase family metal-dependent hydrolase
MRLITYNIHKGIGGRDRKYRLERVVEVLRHEQPDIVCLQEVDRNVKRSHYHDQPQLLAEQIGMAYQCYQLNFPIKDGGYGNLVLSRWPIQHLQHLCLRFGRRKPRGAQCVVVQSEIGDLAVVNWHLGLNGRERLWQAAKLVQDVFVATHGHLPLLVAGDCNDWRNRLLDRVMSKHGFDLVTSPPALFPSFPAFWPVMSLDKVFVRGSVEVKETRVVSTPLTRHASDHLPLVVDFHVKSGEGRLWTANQSA